MKFVLNQLKTMGKDELRTVFSSISPQETTIEISGEFIKDWLDNSFTVAQSLSYLPKHIVNVTLSGHYHIKTTTISIPGYDVAPQIPRTYTYKDIHCSHLGEMLEIFILSLPKSVHSLALNFKPNPLLSLPHDEKVSEELSVLLKKIPAHIKFLDLSEIQIPRNKRPLTNVLKSVPKTVTTLSVFRTGKAIKSQSTHCPKAMARFLSKINLHKL